MENNDDLNDLEAYWEYRKKLSLHKSPNPEAAEELLAKMYGWSAKQKRWGRNAGSWITNMDGMCWVAQPKLHELSAKAGGWWRWCDGVVFIPTKLWLPIFDAWRTRERAQQEQLKAGKLFERLTRGPKGGHWAWVEKRAARLARSTRNTSPASTPPTR